jgi:predicted nucleotidyltransferase component of viral defense system
MQFKLAHHNHILTILNSLNEQVFQENKACFGGGTLIALLYNEYRQSNDIDFICSVSSSGYKNLRSLIFDHGYKTLFSHLNHISIGRSTMDQYGIRMLIKIENSDIFIKTEIIAEGRFTLETPHFYEWTKIPCLSENDAITSKLLANSDRYIDDNILSRDLIDLAILRSNQTFGTKAINKAEQAYEVIRPLKIAIQRFQDRPEYREKCFEQLKISNQYYPIIINGIDLLATDLNLSITQRTFQ